MQPLKAFRIFLFYCRQLLAITSICTCIAAWVHGEYYAALGLFLIGAALFFPFKPRYKIASFNILMVDNSPSGTLMYHILLIARWFFGLLFSAGALGGLLLENKEYLPAIGVLTLGLLLISPLSIPIFERDGWILSTTRDRAQAKKKMVWLVLLRNIGIWVLMIAYSYYMEKALITGHVLYVVGVLMMLSVGVIVTISKQPSMKVTAMQDRAVENGVQTNNAYAVQHIVIPVENVVQAESTPANQVPAIPVEDVIQTEITLVTTEREEQLRLLQQEFEQLSLLQPQQRGFAFQQFLVRLFSLHNLDPRGAFRLTGEEIDGSFELEGNIYLLEAKWQALPCGQKELLAFQGKVEGKAAWVRGLVISYSGFSEQGLAAFANGRRTSIIGMDGRDLAAILEDRTNLVDAIKWKLRRSAETNAFFVSLEDEG